MAAALDQMYNPIWQLFDNNGRPLTNGAIFFFENDDHNEPKDVYINSTGVTAWPNPIILNAAGFQPENYGIFGSGSYYVEFRKTFDRTSELIFSQENLIPPQIAGSTPVVTEVDIENYIINGQLYFDYGQGFFSGGANVHGFSTLPANVDLPVAPGGWFFTKNNTSADDMLLITDFIPGETNPPNNPKAYFNYVCVSPGSGETIKQIMYRYNSVRQFSGETINLQFSANSTFPSTLQIIITQYFGAGGSSTVRTDIATLSLTTSPVNQQVLIDVPSIQGNDIGPNGDDYFQIDFSLPFNTVCNISISNFCNRSGSTFVPFQEESVNITEDQAKAESLPLPVSVNWDDGNYELMMIAGVQSWVPCAGRGEEWYTNTAPSYALLQNGLAYYSADYYNLAQVNLVSNWGTGPQGFTSVLAGTSTVETTCFSNGTVVSGSAGTSGFTFTQTSNGSAMTQGTANIVVNAASTIDQGDYFLINSPATSYYVWYSLNNNTEDPGPSTPALSGKTGVKVVYAGSESNAELGALTVTQMQVAHFRVPDQRGLFARMPNFGATAGLPSTQQVTLTSTANLSGITFAIVGLDVNGNSINENLAGPNNNTVTSVNSYSAITSITPSGAVGTAVSAGISGDADAIALLQTTAGATALIITGVFGRDPDYATRYAMYTGGATGGNVGSEQQNQNLLHTHPYNTDPIRATNGGGGTDLDGPPQTQSNTTGASGGNQSNPNNVYVNKIIYF